MVGDEKAKHESQISTTIATNDDTIHINANDVIICCLNLKKKVMSLNKKMKCAVDFECIIIVSKLTVQFTGNVACRHSQVPQWSPPRGPNADMARTRPESNCVDKHLLREYFYSSARTS